jgi:MYXO-CTERM domain-containing protein
MHRAGPAALVFLLLAAPAHALAGPAHTTLRFGLGEGWTAGQDLPMAVLAPGTVPVATAWPSQVSECVLDGAFGNALAWHFEGQPDQLTESIADPSGRGRIDATLTANVPLPAGLLLARLDAPGIAPRLMVAEGAVGSTYVPALLPGATHKVHVDWPAARDGLFLLELGGRSVRLDLVFCPEHLAGQGTVAAAEGLGSRVQPVLTLGRATLALDAAPVPVPTGVFAASVQPAPQDRTSPSPAGLLLAVALLALASRRRP